jgi:hypothetical protein
LGLLGSGGLAIQFLFQEFLELEFLLALEGEHFFFELFELRERGRAVLGIIMGNLFRIRKNYKIIIN